MEGPIITGFAIRPYDLSYAGKAHFLRNCRIVEPGMIVLRPGLGSPLYGSPLDQLNLHSIKRLNDPTAGTFTRILGAGTKLYADGGTAIDTGYSGLPLSMIPYRPELSVASWLYIADQNRMSKVSTAKTRFNWGIPQPVAPPSVTGGPEPVNVIEDFSVQPTPNWTAGGKLTIGAVGTLVSTTLASIAYAVGNTGNATITLASAANVVDGMLLDFGAGGTYEAAQLHDNGDGTYKVTLTFNHAVGEAVTDKYFNAACTSDVATITQVAATPTVATYTATNDFTAAELVYVNGLTNIAGTGTPPVGGVSTVTQLNTNILISATGLSGTAFSGSDPSGSFSAFAAVANSGKAYASGWLQRITPFALGELNGVAVKDTDQVRLAIRVDNAAYVQQVRVIFDIGVAGSADFQTDTFYADFHGTNLVLPVLAMNIGDLIRTGNTPNLSLAVVRGVRIEMSCSGTVNAQVDGLWLAGGSITITADTKIGLSGNVTAYYWGDSPHSGRVASYIWKNPTDPDTNTAAISRTIADAAGSLSGTSLTFDDGGQNNPSTNPVAWKTYDNNGVATGTQNLFEPALESEGYDDFNVCVVGNLSVPTAGSYTISGAFKDGAMVGIGGAATWTGKGTTTGIVGQTMTVVSGLPLLPITPEMSGSDGVVGNFSVVVTFPSAGIYPIEVDWDFWYHKGRTLVIKSNGAEIVPAIASAEVQYNYIYRYRSLATGATSNWSPATRVAQTLTSQGTLVEATPSTDPQVDSIDFARFGGNLTSGFVILGWGPNSTQPFIDTYLDADIASNDLAALDDFQPFPQVDLPRSGVCNVVGTSVTWVSGDTFNTEWSPGSEILINGTLNTLYSQPSDNHHLELVNSVGTVSNVAFQLTQPMILALPLPVVFGPSEENGVIFGMGSLLQPGTLFWCNGNSPDNASDKNQLELTSPSEPLMNGLWYDGMALVASSSRWFAMQPSFSTDGSITNQYNPQDRPVGRGLFAKWGLWTDGILVFFVAQDGICVTQGSGSQSITEKDLRELFPHDGQPGTAVTIPGVGTIQPPDFTHPEAMRLSGYDGLLYFDYLDTTSTRCTLTYDTKLKSWVSFDVHAVPVVMHYGEEGQGIHSLLCGGSDGNLYQMGGANDGTTPVTNLIAMGTDHGIAGFHHIREFDLGYISTQDVILTIMADSVQLPTVTILNDAGVYQRVNQPFPSNKAKRFIYLFSSAAGFSLYPADFIVRNKIWGAASSYVDRSPFA